MEIAQLKELRSIGTNVATHSFRTLVKGEKLRNMTIVGGEKTKEYLILVVLSLVKRKKIFSPCKNPLG